MLADLERGEMEPERRQLPAQVGDLAPGDARQAIRNERVLDLDQLDIELIRAGVATRQGCGVTGQVGARPAEPLRHEAEALPVGLVGVAPAQLPIEIGQELGVPGEATDEPARHPLGRRDGGDRLGQPGGNGLVPAEDVIGVDPEGSLADLRGDRRVAVAVAPDPRLPGQERPGPGRTSPRSTGVGRLRCSRAGRIGAASCPGDGIERSVRLAVDPGNDGEDRLVEERERGPDLVEGRDGTRPQISRSPQQRDLLAQASPSVAILVGDDLPIAGRGDARSGAGR